MDRRRLQCFVALAEELHFHRAALRSGISQPGLSQQLRQLEEQLQVQLLHRSKRQVSLTRAGEVFLGEARKILNGMEQAVEITRQTDEGVIGQLQVGVTPSALFIILPEVLLRFQEVLPQVRVQVRQMTTAEQEAALLGDDIHVGLLHPPLDDRTLVCTELVQLPFKVVLSEANPLSRKAELTVKDLAEETFVMFPRGLGPRLYDEIIALCHHEGFSPRKIIEVAPAQSIVAMAACNIGVGFVASEVQQYERAHAAYRRLLGPAPRLTISVAHAGDGSVPLARQFAGIARDVATSHRRRF